MQSFRWYVNAQYWHKKYVANLYYTGSEWFCKNKNGSILDLHFNNCDQEVWEVVEKVRDNMYLDDMVTGGESINEVTKWKPYSISLFRLHKWHSKETLSETKYYCNTTELSFAKWQ